MPRFNLDDYVDCQSRINKFWQENPDGAINTAIVSDPNIFARVVFKAEVFKQRPADTWAGTPDATGYAAEEQGTGGANQTSWHENAETSAIGRALANMGYATSLKDRPSREEMEKANRGHDRPPVSEPVSFGASRDTSAFVGRQNASDAASRPVQGNGYDDAPKAIKPGNEGLPASEKQIGYLESLAAERGVDLHDWCPTNTGAAFSELTREGASYAIESIKKLPRN